MASYVSRFLRVYLVDDHDIVRRGLRDLLAPATDIHVVGEAGSARRATEAILEQGVDVMVLDLRLPDGTGIDVCREVRAVDPAISGLLLTSSDDDEALRASILAGAAGYLVKLTNSSDIATAIRKIGAGGSLLDQSTTERATRHLESVIAELQPRLTEREHATLQAVIEGDTNDRIAIRTGVSLETATAEVSALVERIMHPVPAHVPLSAPTAGRHRRTDV